MDANGRAKDGGDFLALSCVEVSFWFKMSKRHFSHTKNRSMKETVLSHLQLRIIYKIVLFFFHSYVDCTEISSMVLSRTKSLRFLHVCIMNINRPSFVRFKVISQPLTATQKSEAVSSSWRSPHHRIIVPNLLPCYLAIDKSTNVAAISCQATTVINKMSSSWFQRRF